MTLNVFPECAYQGPALFKILPTADITSERCGRYSRCLQNKTLLFFWCVKPHAICNSGHWLKNPGSKTPMGMEDGNDKDMYFFLDNEPLSAVRKPC